MSKVLIIGAHSAVAKSLFEVLEERDVELELTLATTTEHLGPGFVLVDESVLKKCDLAVLTMSGPRASQLANAARTFGKPILDLTGELKDEEGATFIFPALDPDAGARFDPNRPAIIPLGVSATIVAVLRAFADLRPVRATLVTQESAAIRDQAGMDELSEQVRARFNMRDVEPKVFKGVLGFGVIPEEEDDELRDAIEAGIEKELPDLELLIMRNVVPTFSADSAQLVLDFEEEQGPSEEEVRARLERTKGVHVFPIDETPSSFDAVGRDDALAGQVTIEPGRAGLWIAVDRLRRGSATLAALALERFRQTVKDG